MALFLLLGLIDIWLIFQNKKKAAQIVLALALLILLILFIYHSNETLEILL